MHLVHWLWCIWPWWGTELGGSLNPEHSWISGYVHVAYRAIGGDAVLTTSSNYQGPMLTREQTYNFIISEANCLTREIPPIGIALVEILPMEITPGIPEYSCPTLIRVEGNDHPSSPPASWPIGVGEDGATRGWGFGGESPEGGGGARQY